MTRLGLNTWVSITLSGFLEETPGGKIARLGTVVLINYKVLER